MSIDNLMQRIFEFLLIGAVSLGVNALKDVSHSINELNMKIGIIVERSEEQNRRIENHEERLRHIEIKR